MTLSLRYAARSDTGLVREGNEDSVYAGPRLLAVADGMGGHAAGEVASAVVIAAVSALDEDVAGSDLLGALRDAVNRANQNLADMVNGDDGLRGMGTTLTALLAEGSRLGLVHVGDSRAYLLRDGRLRQITTDHTLVQALVDEGRITPEEADVHPQRSFITRTLDGTPVELDLSIREAKVGDRYLLCSDGLSGVVSDATLEEALSSELDPGRCADRLIELALRGGGPDNITCIVADVVDTTDADSTPILGGAVAPTLPAPGLPDTSAGRAAAMRPTTHRRTSAAETTDPAPLEPPRRRRLLTVVLAALAVLALGVAGAGYVQAQYYVGSADGNVAVFRGITGSLVGLPLHRVEQRSQVPVAGLPGYEQTRVEQGITASSAADARRIVRTLQDSWQQRCAAAARPTVAPSPRPSSGVTPVPAPTAAPPPGCAG